MIQIKASKSVSAMLVISGAIIGYVAAQSGVGSNFARADVTESAPREAFLGGAERSELVLREISKTLKTMDGRLERLEKLASDKFASEKRAR